MFEEKAPEKITSLADYQSTVLTVHDILRLYRDFGQITNPCIKLLLSVLNVQ
jgi:hypothetical protein